MPAGNALPRGSASDSNASTPVSRGLQSQLTVHLTPERPLNTRTAVMPIASDRNATETVTERFSDPLLARKAAGRVNASNDRFQIGGDFPPRLMDTKQHGCSSQFLCSARKGTTTSYWPPGTYLWAEVCRL